MQRPARRRGVAAAGGGKCRVAVEMMPGADHRLASGDAVEAGADERLRAEPAGGDFLRRRTGRKRERVGHGDLHADDVANPNADVADAEARRLLLSVQRALTPKSG